MGAVIKKVLRQLLGGRILGTVDYWRFSERRTAWGGPFNGQERRRELFAALVQKLRPAAIIETGTHLGTTTEFMAENDVPIYSVEANRRSLGFARARLWRKRHVTIRSGDSRDALRAFFAGPLRSRGSAPILVYLDAHWQDDLPLVGELEIIFGNCPEAAVVIDDFEVPGDRGFAFDDYGPGKALNAAYIVPVVDAHDLMIFYPSASSGEETGARRGCVVLCKSALAGKLRTLPQLRAFAPAGSAGIVDNPIGAKG